MVTTKETQSPYNVPKWLYNVCIDNVQPFMYERYSYCCGSGFDNVFSGKNTPDIDLTEKNEFSLIRGFPQGFCLFLMTVRDKPIRAVKRE